MKWQTIPELRHALSSKQISSVELTQHYLTRIDKLDQHYNSFITVTHDVALAAAKIADAKIAAGDVAPLTGMPIAHKDIFCTQNIKTSCGAKMLDNFIAPYDATVIHKFKQAHTVMLGKTNMDEFAMGSSNENSYYGAVKNPWDLNTVPGGSSGGAAACVSARLAPGSTGTDTGGSIRQPAALCGVTGLKPSYGRVSRYGMIAFASSLDQAGPFAITAEGCALLLNAMAGHDPKDSTSIERAVPDYTAALNHSVKGLKIGLPKQYFDDKLDAGMGALLENAIHEFKKLGAEFVEIDLPHTHLSIPAYYIVAPAECSSNLSRFDGVRYGYRCEDPKDLTDLYSRSRGEAFGAEVKRRILIGTFALSSGFYDAYYIKAQKIRNLISQDFQKAFERVDVILGPTTPGPAFEIGSKTKDPLSMYLSDIYTIALNLAGLPGMSVPAGFIDNKPIGMQLIGKYFDEAKILNVAHQYQQVTDWHLQTPAAIEL